MPPGDVGRAGWRALVAAVLSAPAFAAPARALAQTSPPALAMVVRRLAGCYQLRWRARGSSSDSSPFAVLPSRFELLRSPLAPRFEGYSVHPVALWSGGAMPASWAPADAAGDSLTIGWSTGFHGVELLLSIRNDRLVGRARTFTDGHVRGEPPPPEADVIARRVTCPR